MNQVNYPTNRIEGGKVNPTLTWFDPCSLLKKGREIAHLAVL